MILNIQILIKYPMQKLFSEIDAFEYIPCFKPSHQFQPLSLVCVDKQCEHRSLLCIHCEQQQKHLDHVVVPLKNYLKKTYATVHSELQSNNILNLSSVIEETKLNYIRQFEDMKNKMCEQVDEVVTMMKLYFTKTENEMMKLVNSKRYLKNVIDLHSQRSENIERTMKYMESFLQNGFYDDEEENVKIFQKITFLVDDVNLVFDSNKLKLNDMKSKLKEQLTNIKQCLSKPIETYSLFIKYSWSEKMKGNNMLINGMKVQRLSMSSNQRFALFNQSLHPHTKNKKKVQWFLKISKLTSWIGIGIALKNRMIQQNYQFNYTSLGHGSYLLSSNGYTWSHSIQADNSSFKSFYFSTNDVVRIQLDPQEWQLNFYNMGKNGLGGIKTKGKKKYVNPNEKKFTLQIEKTAEGDEYYPCVNLCSTGDSVEIITQ